MVGRGVGDHSDEAALRAVALKNFAHTVVRARHARPDVLLPEQEFVVKLLRREVQLIGKQLHDAGVKILAEILLQRIV